MHDSSLAAMNKIPFDDAQQVWRDLNIFRRMDDRSVQRVLRESDSRCLAIALHGASQEVREKIFANCSKLAAEYLKEDMLHLADPPFDEVLAEAEKLLEIVGQLREVGSVVVKDPGEHNVFPITR